MNNANKSTAATKRIPAYPMNDPRDSKIFGGGFCLGDMVDVRKDGILYQNCIVTKVEYEDLVVRTETGIGISVFVCNAVAR